jgi:hypothetical protein
VDEWQRTHVIERLRQDIKSSRQRMLQGLSQNAERSEPKTGGLEERVSVLKLKIAQANARVRPTNESSRNKTEAQVPRETYQGHSSSSRLRMRLAEAAEEN